MKFKIKATRWACGAMMGIMVCSVVSAQESLFKLYGLADVALGHQSKGLPPDANNTASIVPAVYANASNPRVGSNTGLWSGGISQNRLGIQGDMALNANWHAGYLAESGINVIKGRVISNAQGLVDNSGAASSLVYQTGSTNGSQNGQWINREGYFAIGRSDWGDVRFGRNTTLIHDSAQAFDPIAASQMFGYLTASSGFGGGSGISETTRLNQSVKYLHQYQGWKLGLFYAKGDHNGLTSTGQARGVSLGQEWGKLKVQFARMAQTQGIKESVSATPGDVSATLYDSKGWLLASSYVVTPNLTFKAGSSHYALSAPQSAAGAAGLSSVNGYLLSAAPTLYKGSDIVARLDWLGLSQHINAQWSIYTALYRANFGGYTSTTGSTYNSTPGHVNWLSILLDHTLDASSDVYVGWSHMGLSDTTAQTAITGASKVSSGYSPVSSNALFAIGYRIKF
jgi:predicted porin